MLNGKIDSLGGPRQPGLAPPLEATSSHCGLSLVHVTIVTQATVMIDAAHQTCTQRRVGEHRVSVGCTAPPTAWPAHARPSIRKLPIEEIERLEPASPRSCEPRREPRRKVVSNIIQIGIHRCQARPHG